MNIWWVRVVSYKHAAWHQLLGPNDTVTPCGRIVPSTAERLDSPPQEHHCGTCDRIVGPR